MDFNAVIGLTDGKIIKICVYLVSFCLIFLAARGINWSKILDPRHKVEGLIMTIIIIIALSYCLGSFINALIPIQ